MFNNQLYQHLRIIYNKSKSFAKKAIVINFVSTKKIIVINFKFINKFIIIVIATTKTPSLINFHTSKVVHLNVTNVTTEEYVFREHRFVTILMMFILIKQSYKLCFDTRYIINLIDRKFLFEVFPSIIIKKMSTLMIIKDINVNMHNVNEYIKL